MEPEFRNEEAPRAPSSSPIPALVEPNPIVIASTHVASAPQRPLAYLKAENKKLKKVIKIGTEKLEARTDTVTKYADKCNKLAEDLKATKDKYGETKGKRKETKAEAKEFAEMYNNLLDDYESAVDEWITDQNELEERIKKRDLANDRLRAKLQRQDEEMKELRAETEQMLDQKDEILDAAKTVFEGQHARGQEDYDRMKRCVEVRKAKDCENWVESGRSLGFYGTQ